MDEFCLGGGEEERSSRDQSLPGIEVCYLVALDVDLISPISYRYWWIAASLPLWYSRVTSGLTNNNTTASKIRAQSVYSHGYCCSIWWMHRMLVALLRVFWGTKFIKISSLLFSCDKAGEGGRGTSCHSVSVKLLPQMLSWLLVTVSEMAAFCKSGLKIDLFGYACSLKGTLSVWFSPNIVAWLLLAVPSLLSCQPIWPGLQWAWYYFT